LTAAEFLSAIATFADMLTRVWEKLMYRRHIGFVAQGHHTTSVKMENVLAVAEVCSFLIKCSLFRIYVPEVELKSATWFRKILFSLVVNVK
jgi:hypothetical protein